jgi:hypothetical protein
LPVTGYQLPVTGYRLPVTGYQLPGTGKYKYRRLVSGYRLQVTGFRLQVSGFREYRNTGYRVPVTSYQLPGSGKYKYRRQISRFPPAISCILYFVKRSELSVQPFAFSTIEAWILAFYSLLGCFDAPDCRVDDAAYSADTVALFTFFYVNIGIGQLLTAAIASEHN